MEQDKKIDMPAVDGSKENWNMCCSRSSTSFVKYMVQVLVSMTILVFAIVNISMGRNDAVYWSLITLIVGVFVPSPTLSKQPDAS
jgi:hypothetical protein